MPLLFSSRKRHSFLKDVEHDLHKHMERKDKVQDKFIPRGSLEAIWSEARLEKFIDAVRPGFDKGRISDIRKDYLQTISILVYIHWDDWTRFTVLFLDQNRVDRKIPDYTADDLEKEGFLGPLSGSKFFTDQYIFCPIDIYEGMNIVRSEGWRLPFPEADSGEIGQGGYSHVTKETIPKGHFRHQVSYSPDMVTYGEDLKVARKRLSTKGDFRKEINNLMKLRSSLSNHNHIVPFLATVTVGREFHIILPLADKDLEVFLSGNPRSHLEFPMHHLLTQASNVAGALEFLHEGIQAPQPGTMCCHMDLKPENILVFRDRDSPVGKWKISDFGISTIRPSEHQPTMMGELVDNINDTVRQNPLRPPGPFQPPEARDGCKVGRRSDVWSLGCILVRILAFGLKGREGMKKLDQMRARADDGVSDYHNDYFHRGEPAVRNPHVEHWLQGLNSLDHSYSQDFLTACSSLILSMLEIDKKDRPSAKYVGTRLKQIISQNLGPVSCIVTHEPDIPTEMIRPFSSNTTPNSSNGRRQSHSTNGLETARVKDLVNAINDNDMAGIQTLLNGTVNIEGIHKKDRPLIHAIRKNSTAAVEMLLFYQADMDLELPDSNGDTPLNLAAKNDQRELVNVLLGANASIDAPSKGGMTALMTASRHGHQAVVQTLLDRGADCLLYCEDGFTCLHYAAKGDKVGAAVINALSSKLGTVNVPGRKWREGETPFLTLVKSFVDRDLWWDKFKALLAADADVNKPDKTGVTPLSVAVNSKSLRLAKYLLEKQHAKYGDTELPTTNLSEMKDVVKQIRADREGGPRPRRSRFTQIFK